MTEHNRLAQNRSQIALEKTALRRRSMSDRPRNLPLPLDVNNVTVKSWKPTTTTLRTLQSILM